MSASRKVRAKEPQTAPLDESTPVALPDQPPSDIPPPTPESRARDNPEGIPAILGDGRTWILARCGLARAIGPLRDEFYAGLMTREGVTGSNILAGAWFALSVNYDLAAEEMRALLGATDPATIVGEVVEAIIPLVREGVRADFTEWARSALFANGINPSDIPEADLPWVLDHLVAAKMAMPHEEFTAAGIAASQRGQIMATVKVGGAPRGAILPTE